ncbi:hypothetical protein ACI5KX_14145 [Erythrobacter sp. GH1-10]|uniref:hypothetical protein n=1 Tax=Erythrobacter sp. GH1-10 TaxID=3349334 RepID=UPI0038783C8A
MKLALGCTALLFLGGCATSPGLISEPVPYRELIRHIKHDVGTYVFKHQSDPVVIVPEDMRGIGPNGPMPLTAAERDSARQAALEMASGLPNARVAKSDEICGEQVSFEIESVQITVANQVDRSGTFGGGFALEVAPVKVSGSGKVTNSLKDTVATSLTVYPAEQIIDSQPPPSKYFVGTPINDTLEALASDLAATANTRPCFEFRPDTKGSVNTLTWTFIVSSKAETGGKLSLILFSTEASRSEATSNSNTIKITLRPNGAFGS